MKLPFRTLINFGKTDPSCLPTGRYVLINHPDGVLNAADKRRTKEKFQEASIPTAEWWPDFDIPEKKFPIVVKHRFGSRGTGVYLMKTPEDLHQFFATRGESLVKDKFIAEQFKNYRFEYRLHATATEVFLANRKGRVDGVPGDERWKHQFDNSVWFKEDNPLFHKPSTWEDIKATASKAITSLGMDFGAVDIKVNQKGEFFIIEVNSAPSLGEVTRDHYIDMIPRLAEQIKTTRGFFRK